VKTSDVKLGSVYLTRIAGALCPVTVVSYAARRLIPKGFNEYSEGPARFYVKRHGETSTLPKPRTAAALREVPAQTFNIIDQPWPVLVRRAFQAGTDARFYDVTIDAFGFATTLEAKSAAHAAVLAARGMVARAVFGAPCATCGREIHDPLTHASGCFPS